MMSSKSWRQSNCASIARTRASSNFMLFAGLLCNTISDQEHLYVYIVIIKYQISWKLLMSAMENESLPGRILRHYYHIIKILLHAGYTKSHISQTRTFQVQGDPIYKSGVQWTADNNIYDARTATLEANLNGVDAMSWWCNSGGGGVAGVAFLGALCSSYNTNLNEYWSTQSGAGFVCICQSI